MKKRILALLIAIATVFTVVGCGNVNGNGSGNGGGGDSDNKTLKITVSKLGYGTEWLKKIVSAYETKTGAKVEVVEPVGSAGIDAIYAEMESLASDSDIFMTRQRHFFETIYKGSISVGGKKYPCQYADLTDVYEAKDESGSSIMDRADPLTREYFNMDGKYYGLCWANGVFGIVRNKDVWDSLGFTDDDVPLTTDQLLAVCDAIKTKSTGADGIAPFIYSYDDEYYTSIAPIWFGQYEGVQSMDYFGKGLDPAGQSTYNVYAYDGQLKSLEFLNELIKDSNGYQHKASKDLTFTDMQAYFAMGQAVFCVNGGWLEVESSTARKKNLDFIKTPVISALSEKLSYYNEADKAGNDQKLAELIKFVDAHAEKGDNEGRPSYATEEDVQIVREARQFAYLSSDRDHIASIPAYSKHIDTAKDFLKFMYSDAGLQIYYETTGGAKMPYATVGNYDETKITKSRFRKSIESAMEEGYFLDYNSYVKAKLYSIGKVDLYYHNGITATAMKALLEGTTPAEIVNINAKYLQTNWKTITDY